MLSARPRVRLAELDALRGIAAVLVMLFHFTFQYEQLYGHRLPLSFSVPWGHYGVNLFFMISGFVIFLTLHRIERPMDFLVSRLSRLFPAYWVAVILTFLLTNLLALPEKTVTIGTAIANFMMFHGLFRIPHVDDVYWTLEVELLFYVWSILLYRLGWLNRVHLALALLLALRLAYFVAERYFGVDLPFTLSRLLILPYIPWFCCGIMIYRRVYLSDQTPLLDWCVLAIAIGTLAMVNGLGVGLLAIGLSGVLLAATLGRLPLLASPVLVWLGAISYTLYLLHENIGWGLIWQVQQAGLSTGLSIFLAILVALLMATVLTKLVEVPAMRWLREKYKRQHAHAAGPPSTS